MDSISNNFPRDSNIIELGEIHSSPLHIASPSNNSAIDYVPDDSDRVSDDPFKYALNDAEEEEIMAEMGRKNEDHDLVENLIFGRYFGNNEYIARKRLQYGVVRGRKYKEKKYSEYQKKYYEKLEDLDNKERQINMKEKDYQDEYYKLLEIQDQLKARIEALKEELKKCEENVLKREREKRNIIENNEKEKMKLLEENDRKEAKNLELEENFRLEKKEIFKKAMIKCSTCFGYFYKGDILFTGCRHYMCKKCFEALDGVNTKTCPTCRSRGIRSIEIPHFGDDLNSEDFSNYEKDKNL